MDARLRHLGLVLGIDSELLGSVTAGAPDRCSSIRTAWIVVAQPWKAWPMADPIENTQQDAPIQPRIGHPAQVMITVRVPSRPGQPEHRDAHQFRGTTLPGWRLIPETTLSPSPAHRAAQVPVSDRLLQLAIVLNRSSKPRLVAAMRQRAVRDWFILSVADQDGCGSPQPKYAVMRPGGNARGLARKQRRKPIRKLGRLLKGWIRHLLVIFHRVAVVGMNAFKALSSSRTSARILSQCLVVLCRSLLAASSKSALPTVNAGSAISWMQLLT